MNTPFQLSVLVLISVLLSACATMPTSYAPVKNGLGLKVETVKEDIQVSYFFGNPQTSAKRAYHYSRLGAIEQCQKERKTALLAGTVNASEKISYTQVSTDSYTVPGYSKFQGKTYRDSAKDQNYSNTYSYPVQLTYPRFATVFKCAERFMVLAGSPVTESISRELVSPITRDFKGGLLVKDPGRNSVLKESDVIVAADEKRIEASKDLSDVLTAASSRRKVTLGILRDQKRQTVIVPLEDLQMKLFLLQVEETAAACKQRNENEPEIQLCNTNYLIKSVLEEGQVQMPALEKN